LLCDIEDTLASQLHSMLAAFGDTVSHQRRSLAKADLIFCGANPDALQGVLRDVRNAQRQVPVVVVSREDSVASWLDALEAGAADYLPAPFERAQLDWIRQAQLASPPAAPAAAH
jgi:DNA-binding response OmpR family regulator